MLPEEKCGKTNVMIFLTNLNQVSLKPLREQPGFLSNVNCQSWHRRFLYIFLAVFFSLYTNAAVAVDYFSLPANIESFSDLTKTVKLIDVDNDGDIDLISGNYGQTNKLYLNNGSGSFSGFGSSLGTDTDDTWSLALGDVDGDGDIDLVAGNEGQTNKLYLNDGSGGFSASGTNIGSDTDDTISVALGDVDGDGDLDLVAGNYDQDNDLGKANKLYLNNGSGSFSATGIVIGTETDRTSAVALGDVDGDGDLDLMTGNSEQVNKLYLNDGSGGFSTNGIGFSSETNLTTGLMFGDVDADGDLDLLTANFNQTNKLYLNNGSGGFIALGIPIGTDTDATKGLVLGDVDGDGDLDMVASNQFKSNKVYVNDGSGGFSATGSAVDDNDTDNSIRMALGDVDKDGDLDLVTASGNYADHNKLNFNIFEDFDNDGIPDDVDTDDDNDGVPDTADSCLTKDYNISADNDSDGCDDADEDMDDDNDGMGDEWEVFYGFDPLSDFDAQLDGDFDQLTNLDEFTQGSDPTKPNANLADIQKDIIKRAEIAKRILLKVYGLGYIPPAATGAIYNDVQATDFNASWIEQLTADGITEGCASNEFCPDMAVTKGQLSKLLLKAVFGSAFIPTTATGTLFTDVTPSTFSADWIEELLNQGFTDGCDALNFCPNEAVTIEGFNTMLDKVFP